jgi:peroxiredoxin
MPEYGLSGRSERYSMVVENGVVKSINIEKSVLDHGISSAATCMLHM